MEHTPPRPQADVLNVSLEAVRLDTIAATYPESIREDFLWLGGYIADRCNRSLDVLVHNVRKLGFTITKETFSKILRGKLQVDAEGQPTKSPVIALRNFSQIVDALRSEAKVVWLAGKTPFIETETWLDFEAYITMKRAPETICKFGLILGHTGSQKTACGKHYAHLHNSGRCIHLEAPEKPTMGRFVRELGNAYRIPEKINGEKLRIRITGNVKDTSTLIVDNIQRLYKPNHGWNQEIFNYLQKLQDDTNCTVILIAIPDFEDTLRAGSEKGYFEQFVGRVGGWNEVLRLPDWTPREDVLAIAEAFRFQNAEKHLEALEKLTKQQGRVRILFNALQKAKRLADAKDQKLTINHLRAALGEEAA